MNRESFDRGSTGFFSALAFLPHLVSSTFFGIHCCVSLSLPVAIGVVEQRLGSGGAIFSLSSIATSSNPSFSFLLHGVVSRPPMSFLIIRRSAMPSGACGAPTRSSGGPVVPTTGIPSAMNGHRIFSSTSLSLGFEDVPSSPPFHAIFSLMSARSSQRTNERATKRTLSCSPRETHTRWTERAAQPA